jgi:uncharacterized protein (TIGR02001 family)
MSGKAQSFVNPNGRKALAFRRERMMRFPALVAISLAAAASAAANAAVPPGTGLSLSGSATLVSDYRFRGVSQSGKDPALQLDLSLAHTSGLYVSAWASTIDLYDDDPANGFDGGKDIEIDAIAGWSGDVAPGLSADVNVTY